MTTDISILNLTFSHTPKNAGVISPVDYIKTATTLSNGHDYATVFAQASRPTTPHPSIHSILAIGGHFIKGHVEYRTDTESGLTVQIIPNYINVLTPGCEVVTEANAAEKFFLFRARLAELSDLREYNAWLTDYMSENYTITHTTQFDTSEVVIEWWIDHDFAFPRINNAV